MFEVAVEDAIDERIATGVQVMHPFYKADHVDNDFFVERAGCAVVVQQTEQEKWRPTNNENTDDNHEGSLQVPILV